MKIINLNSRTSVTSDTITSNKEIVVTKNKGQFAIKSCSKTLCVELSGKFCNNKKISSITVEGSIIVLGEPTEEDISHFLNLVDKCYSITFVELVFVTKLVSSKFLNYNLAFPNLAHLGDTKLCCNSFSAPNLNYLYGTIRLKTQGNIFLPSLQHSSCYNNSYIYSDGDISMANLINLGQLNIITLGRFSAPRLNLDVKIDPTSDLMYFINFIKNSEHECIIPMLKDVDVQSLENSINTELVKSCRSQVIAKDINVASTSSGFRYLEDARLGNTRLNLIDYVKHIKELNTLSKPGVYTVNESLSYLYADGILLKLTNSFEIHLKYGVYSGPCASYLCTDTDNSTVYVVAKDNLYAHGASLAEAIKDIKFKLVENIDYKDIIQNLQLTPDENYAISVLKGLYRSITGACTLGMEKFYKNNLQDVTEITIRELVDKTKETKAYKADLFESCMLEVFPELKEPITKEDE